MTASRLPVGGLALAVSVPFLFLHETYQPFGVDVGAVDVRPSDLAGLGVVLVALRYGDRTRLRAGPLLWWPLALFLVYALAACFWPLARESGYDWRTYSVAALKFAEYALLAPAAAMQIGRASWR